MWFRRNNKTDADSTLSDTLQSLQSLLGAEKQDPSDSSSAASVTRPRPPGTDKTGDAVPLIKTDEKNISNAVASDEHLEWDFKVDLAVEDAPGMTLEPGFLQPVESDAIPGLKNPEGSAVIPIRRNREAAADVLKDTPELGAGDTFPVLDKIVELHGRDGPGNAESKNDQVEAAFVEQCLKDIRKRLKRNELTPLTPNQEKQLHTALTSLLLQKKSGKFE